MTSQAAKALPFAITIGGPKNNPRGKYCPCTPSVTSVAELLRSQPPTLERWWSPHLWLRNHRTQNNWLSSTGISIDVDYNVDNETPPLEVIEKLEKAAYEGDLPCSIFHLTPHGARCIWVYAEPCSDRKLQQRAEMGAAVLVTRALTQLELLDHYQVDGNPTGDLARFFYTPNAIAKGVERSNVVVELNQNLTNPVDLSGYAPAEVAPPESVKRPVARLSTDYAEALKQWNDDHPGDWPKNSAPCPMCGGRGCFGKLPEDPARWCCFDTDHDATAVGHKGERTWWGDALDVAAHQRGCKPIDVLRQDGYLAAPRRRDPPPPDPEGIPPLTDEDAPPHVEPNDRGPTPPSPPPSGGEPPRSNKPAGGWRSRSYKTAVEIIEKNARNILEDRKLELNEMTGDIELGRIPITDADAHRIRYLIEAKFSGGEDKKGNQVGLQLSSADIFAAIAQVAKTHQYQPVREYLQSLIWDSESRIDLILICLRAELTNINRAMVKCFLVSAVARPMDPGCKVDTIFVLQGPQGALKSSFFKVLTRPWFIDTVIDFRADPVRAYMTMRKAWVLEWAELESMFRVKSASATKAFITSSEDSYVPKHARYSITVKRAGVIVGTINLDEFLSDDTGHRRFHPLKVGENIDLKTIETFRDQIWAEAAHLYQTTKLWWLTKEEESNLRGIQDGFAATTDEWTQPVLDYVSQHNEIAIREVLGSALCIPRDQWTDDKVKRICRILKASGGWKANPNKEKGKPRTWVKLNPGDA